jgi:hypothetical protein
LRFSGSDKHNRISRRFDPGTAMPAIARTSVIVHFSIPIEIAARILLQQAPEALSLNSDIASSH